MCVYIKMIATSVDQVFLEQLFEYSRHLMELLEPEEGSIKIDCITNNATSTISTVPTWAR